MNKIKFIKGDATAPKEEGNKVIAHVCNDIGGWGRGFVVALSNRWPQPEAEYRRWHSTNEPNFALGEAQLVRVEDDIWVANMVGQRDIKNGPKGPPVRYSAIEKALEVVGQAAKELDASVHMPRIGSGLAGGQWSKIEPLIERALLTNDVRVRVYDFGA